jgi:hypothetical protein
LIHAQPPRRRLSIKSRNYLDSISNRGNSIWAPFLCCYWTYVIFQNNEPDSSGTDTDFPASDNSVSVPRTLSPAATIRKPITVSGLTPITMYGFQVQALGVLGYSDWSTIETIVVN